MSGPKVFVIDDDDSVRKALSRLVRSVGLDAATFSSAKDFLAEKPSDRPSCLVLDVRMPGISGLDLQEQLRRSGRELPIIFITGHGDVPMSVRAMKAGAMDFLEKPFNDQQLLDAIQRALEQDREARLERAEQSAIDGRVQSLTPREREVLALVIKGMPNREIGTRLGASEKTIKVHRGRVMAKLGAASLPELVRMAARVGIHGPDSGS